MEQCKVYPEGNRDECQQQCERIYDDYARTLQARYQDNKERLDMEVKNSPIFTSKARPGRDGLFYWTFGVSWDEVFGKNKPPQ